MKKTNFFHVCLILLIAVPGIITPSLSQTSIAGTWKGIFVLAAYSNDPIGAPGDIVITLYNESGRLKGSLEAGTTIFGELENIKFTNRKLTASMQWNFAGQKTNADILLMQDNKWLYGVMKLGIKIGAADHCKIYVKRQ